MVCDLCRTDSDRIVQVNSWAVCQWCITNNVHDRDLEEETALIRLTEAAAEMSAAHQRDVMNETVAESEVETAYADLTTALHDLASTRALSKESLRQALAAQEAIEEYKERAGRPLSEMSKPG